MSEETDPLNYLNRTVPALLWVPGSMTWDTGAKAQPWGYHWDPSPTPHCFTFVSSEHGVTGAAAKKKKKKLHGNISFPPKFNLCAQLVSASWKELWNLWIQQSPKSQFRLWLQTLQRKKKYIAGRSPSSPNKSVIVIVSWKMRDAIYVSKIFPDRADNSFLPIFSCIRNTWLSRLKQNN